MTLRCEPGDIALVVRAEHMHNIGLIVRVITPYLGGDIDLPCRGFLWEVECKQLQMWMMNGQIRWRHRGPVPDDYLLPLRNQPSRSALANTSRQAQPTQPQPTPPQAQRFLPQPPQR